MNDAFVCAGENFSTYQNNVPAPLFRKEFYLKEKVESILTIGATGFYELYLNGEKITKGYLAPFISNPDDTVFFDRYDLTDKLCEGDNTIDVLLGNGFSNPIGGEIWEHTKRAASPSFSLDFHCGNFCFSAKDMLWKSSHILFDDCRIGTYCDARLYSISGNLIDFPGEWNPPVLAPTPKGEKRFTTCEPVKEIRRLKAVEIVAGGLRDYRMRDAFINTLYNGETVMGSTCKYGGYIYDFGENNAGVPRLKIKGKKGQKIDLQFSELQFEGFVDYINVDVYPDGCCQRDVYICGSDEEEIYIPPFTYHGFRYCYVYGITPEQATPDLLEYIILHNDVKVKADFLCSDEISNQIFAACRRSDESNLVNIITDCPQREKNGWTGDVTVSIDHYMFNLGVENCIKDWLSCVRNVQGSNGNLPTVVPSTTNADNCPVWDSVLFFAPFAVYQYTGDVSIIEDNADCMMKNLRYYMDTRDERGLVEMGMGDWLPVDTPVGIYNSPLGFCCSVILMEACRMGDIMLRKIGRNADADYCAQSREHLKQAIRLEYNEGGIITAGKTKKYQKNEYKTCQTSQALGLYAGVFEQDEIKVAVDTLISCIKEKNNSFDCGFLGMRTIFHVLAEQGFADLAYYMITKPTHPSYANMIYRGETTVWERFSAPGKRIGSHNHHFMADVSVWYLRHVVGISVNPFYNDPDFVIIQPKFIKQLEFAKGSYTTPNGKVEVKWQRTDDKIHLTIRTEGLVKFKLGNDIKDQCEKIEIK